MINTRRWAKTWSQIGLTVLLLVAPVMAWSPAGAMVSSDHPVRSTASKPDETHRLIVKLKPQYRAFTQSLTSANEASFSKSAGVPVYSLRAMSGNSHVVRMDKPLHGAELDAVVAKLSKNSMVESVEPDLHVYATAAAAATPNDPYFGSQWYLQTVANGDATSPSINVVPAWGIVSGVAPNPARIVVAVVDTGARFDHPDLYYQYIAGYDFISADCLIAPDIGGVLDPKVPLSQSKCTGTNNYQVANNGHGRSPDATDPGDWISADDLTNSFFSGCTEEDSSWHGTRVAGLIDAQSNNGIGITGVTGTVANVKILPVRALGKCGGYTSDIVDAIYWAAGVPSTVYNSGVPDNTTPARIINLSLGSRSATVCQTGSAFYNAITTVISRGVVVVAAAGNSSSSMSVPASCPGVISVGAIANNGLRTTYSNMGSNTGSIGTGATAIPAAPMTLVAPGGEPVAETIGSPSVVCTSTDVGICSTINNGAQGPLPYTNLPTDGYSPAAGTSFSAPLVSGIVALMVTAKPGLSVDQITSGLKNGARRFASFTYLTVGGQVTGPYSNCALTASGTTLNAGTSQCICTTTYCGAGMADALNSVANVLAAVPPQIAPVLDPIANQTATAGTPFSMRITGYDANVGDNVSFVLSGQPVGATFDTNSGIFTWTPPANTAGTTLNLSVFPTDGTLNGTSKSFTLTVNAAPASGSGGGGGGSVDLLNVFLLAVLLASIIGHGKKIPMTKVVR